MKKYRLDIISHGKPGFYESSTLVGLFLTRLKHQLAHFMKSGKWKD